MTFWTPTDTYIVHIYEHTKFGANRPKIEQEFADVPLCAFFQDNGRRHLRFVVPLFWTIYDIPIGGLYVSCQCRNDQAEFVRDIVIIQFRDFGWKMPISANFGVL